MRHLRAGASGVLAAAVLIGCGPGKELPDEIPKSTASNHSPTDVKEKIPTTSDPAAVEIVERAINAHTRNNRAALEKGKLSKLTADGTIVLPLGPTQEETSVPSHRIFLARWPDEIKLTQAFQSHISGTMTMILNRSFTWSGLGTKADPITNPAKAEEVMRTDGMGMHWLTLLFPLTDRHAIVFEPRKGAGIGSPPADVVRFAFSGRPTYRLHFAPASGYLVQIDYVHEDAGGEALKEWIVSDHKMFGGILLPTRMSMARTPARSKVRRVVEEWTVEKWEFPEKFDDGTFDPPK
jgi:hypothetical protein